MAKGGITVRRLCSWLLLTAMVLGIHGLVYADKEKLVIIAGGVTPLREKFFREYFIPAFEERYGVEVEFTPVGWGEFADTVIVRTAAGMQIDLIASGNEQPCAFLDVGAIRPMTEFIERWGQMDDYPAPLWQAYTVNGEIYHIPDYGIHTETIWWNKDLFEQAGLPSDQGPETWNDVVRMGRKLTRRGPDGEFEIVGFDTPSMFNLLPQAGGRILSEEQPYRPVFQEEGGLEALQFIHDLIWEHQITPVQRRWFGSGKVAMAYTHDHPMRAAADPENPITWEMLGQGLPLRKAEGWPRKTLLFVNSWFMSANTADPVMAWNFLEMLEEPEWQIKRVQIEPSDRPVRFSVNERISEWASPERKPFLLGMLEAMSYGHVYPEAIIPEWNDVLKRFSEHINKAVAGEISPKHAITAAAEEIEAILKKR